jgi:N-acetyl-gamma-glutamyl-phosphate reductase
MLKVGVVGCTGYSGQELVDILLDHPGVEITCLTARFDKPEIYSDVYPRFKGRTSLVCESLNVDAVCEKTDLIFTALPHTISMDVVPRFIEKGKKVIDLSADYRLSSKEYTNAYRKEHSDVENIDKAVYGLPEMNRDKIKKAFLVANPGCYPTSVILGLLPIIKEVKQAGLNIVVDSKSGASGAGRKADISLSFSEINENFKCYKPNEHQHIPEMESILSRVVKGEIQVNFIPHLLPVTRGILSSIYIEDKGVGAEAALRKKYVDYFSGEPFIRISEQNYMPGIRDVAGTNYCDIGIKIVRGMIIIVSVIDNLLKGASGQAVQNMNIMFGLDETAGLK